MWVVALACVISGARDLGLCVIVSLRIVTHLDLLIPTAVLLSRLVVLQPLAWYCLLISHGSRRSWLLLHHRPILWSTLGLARGSASSIRELIAGLRDFVRVSSLRAPVIRHRAVENFKKKQELTTLAGFGQP